VPQAPAPRIAKLAMLGLYLNSALLDPLREKRATAMVPEMKLPSSLHPCLSITRRCQHTAM
jgi:hypothetical protein